MNKVKCTKKSGRNPTKSFFHFFSIMPQTGIEPVREYKSRRILSPVRLPVPPLRHTKHLLIPFKKISSQPHICSQPCQFRLRNCVHHPHSFKIQSILNGWRRIRTVLVLANRLLYLFFMINGWRRIRTFEGVANRFTVCPLWPLGNPSIFLKQIASTSIYLYHICSENASNFYLFLLPSVCMLYLAYHSNDLEDTECLILQNTHWKHH